jgi:predicted amidohydrolase
MRSPAAGRSAGAADRVPEFAHAADLRARVGDADKPVVIPNEHTERLIRKARDTTFIQSGSMIEQDPQWPGAVQHDVPHRPRRHPRRKVNPWIPTRHASPHDLPGYEEPLFPVADTEIGRIGCAICYDWLFPEAIRQLAANGAEVLLRVSAYMDPWGATEPMNWWTTINRARAIENIAYVVAANQGASLRTYPPYSWPGGSQVVDFDGRMLAEASPGPGERIVVAPIDISAVRHERETRRGHDMLAHLRTEAYPIHREHRYPPADASVNAPMSHDGNVERIDAAKRATDRSANANGGVRGDTESNVAKALTV